MLRDQNSEQDLEDEEQDLFDVKTSSIEKKYDLDANQELYSQSAKTWNHHDEQADDRIHLFKPYQLTDTIDAKNNDNVIGPNERLNGPHLSQKVHRKKTPYSEKVQQKVQQKVQNEQKVQQDHCTFTQKVQYHEKVQHEKVQNQPKVQRDDCTF